MFPGSPARILSSWPLQSLIGLAPPRTVLGVWLRGCTRPQTVRCRGPDGPRSLLASDDLGYLLRRCSQVAFRDGDTVTAAPAGVLVRYRVLEIVLAAPYLPPGHQLYDLFPAAWVRHGVVALPIGLGSPEEALALCAAERLPVAGTRIAYRCDSVDALPAGSLG